MYSGKSWAGSGSALPPFQHNPQPSWPLAIAQAETEKLGMGGASVLVQGIARDHGLGCQAGPNHDLAMGPWASVSSSVKWARSPCADVMMGQGLLRASRSSCCFWRSGHCASVSVTIVAMDTGGVLLWTRWN